MLGTFIYTTMGKPAFDPMFGGRYPIRPQTFWERTDILFGHAQSGYQYLPNHNGMDQKDGFGNTSSNASYSPEKDKVSYSLDYLRCISQRKPEVKQWQRSLYFCLGAKKFEFQIRIPFGNVGDYTT